MLYTGIFDIIVEWKSLKKYSKYAVTVIFIKIKMRFVISETGFFSCTIYYLLFLVAVQSKAWVCSHFLAGIAGLNPAGARMSFLLSVVCCYADVFSFKTSALEWIATTVDSKTIIALEWLAGIVDSTTTSALTEMSYCGL
jgi:hypothetical protein